MGTLCDSRRLIEVLERSGYRIGDDRLPSGAHRAYSTIPSPDFFQRWIIAGPSRNLAVLEGTSEGWTLTRFRFGPGSDTFDLRHPDASPEEVAAFVSAHVPVRRWWGLFPALRRAQ